MYTALPAPAGAARHRRVLAVLVAGLLAVPGLLTGAVARADDGDITGAPPLRWGFKASWRNYVPAPQVAGGATVVPTPDDAVPYDLVWAFDSGSYDADTGSTVVSYTGSAHWTKYRASELGFPPPPGYHGDPDPYILDVTIADPQIVISKDFSAITAHAISRDRDTWQLVDYGRVPIVRLDPVGITPAVVDGVTTWTGLPAHVAEEGNLAFGGTYQVGQAVDPVDFSYSGPGGAPDFSEHFDQPGAPRFRLAESVLYVDDTQTYQNSTVWIDRQNLIVHVNPCPLSVGCGQTPDGRPARTVQAFSLRHMRPLTASVALARDTCVPQSEVPVRFYDSTRGRLYFRNVSSPDMRWVAFDPDTGEYSCGTAAAQLNDPAFIGQFNPPQDGLAWDGPRQRGWKLSQVDGGWQLVTYHENADGTWTRQDRPVPDGQYPAQTSFRSPAWATASDGSYLALGGGTLYRIVLDPHDQVSAVQTLLTGLTADYVVQAFGNGHILLTGTTDLQPIHHCRIGPGGQATCDPPVTVPNPPRTVIPYERYTVDPADGTIYHYSAASQTLWAFRNGTALGSQFIPQLNPRGGPIVVGDDHSLYVPTADSPAVFGGSATWGFGRLERIGSVPAVTTQPDSQTVTLLPGQATTSATFVSDATGEPAPSRQWQVKAPGESTFTDLVGQTGASLTVPATADSDGTQYRAVYTNAAGRVATDAATLTVHAAPSITVQPQPATVTAGQPAQFRVLPAGSPYPDIIWQRYVDGSWIDLDPADPAYEIEGGVLTLPSTTADQDGARFRAKLVNIVAAVYSDEVTLTVTAVAGPDSETVTVTVPQQPPGGEFTLTVPQNAAVAMTDATSRGSYLESTGDLRPITVTDTRTGGPEWSVSGQVGDFNGGALSGRYLGWTPNIHTAGAGATAGQQVTPGLTAGSGLTDAATLASAGNGHEPGTAVIGASLRLQVPATTYTTTLTLTALS
jgi:hypothetical protein